MRTRYNYGKARSRGEQRRLERVRFLVLFVLGMAMAAAVVLAAMLK